jgi:hypothetical protein
MIPNQPPAKPTPKFGALKRRTPAELDALSQPGPADVVAANDLWRSAAPRPLRDLLDAAPEEPA